jgi:hypothetical protein
MPHFIWLSGSHWTSYAVMELQCSLLSAEFASVYWLAHAPLICVAVVSVEAMTSFDMSTEISLFEG